MPEQETAIKIQPGPAFQEPAAQDQKLGLALIRPSLVPVHSLQHQDLHPDSARPEVPQILSACDPVCRIPLLDFRLHWGQLAKLFP